LRNIARPKVIGSLGYGTIAQKPPTAQVMSLMIALACAVFVGWLTTTPPLGVAHACEAFGTAAIRWPRPAKPKATNPRVKFRLGPETSDSAARLSRWP
jgi:hypothetical protein